MGKKIWKKSTTLSITVVVGILCLIPMLNGISVDNGKILTYFNYDGKTLFVGGSGPNNYTRIQDAINDAQNGDTVFVYNGTYYGNIKLNKAIHLIGENKYTTIIDGRRMNDVISVSTDLTVIRGFTIQNSGRSDSLTVCDAGIEFHSDKNTVSDTIVSNNKYGIYIESFFNSNIIADSNISSNDIGVVIWGSGNTLSHNIISCNDQGGVFFWSDSNTAKKNIISNNGRDYRGMDFTGWCNTIVDNVFLNNGVFASTIEPYQDIVLNNTVDGKPLIYLENERNKVVDNAGQVILVQCEDITVMDSEISHVPVGIQLRRTKNCLIIDNKISNCTWEGVYLTGSLNNIIAHNYLSHNSAGIGLSSSSDNDLIFNTLVYNTEGIRVGEGSSNSILNNIISSNSGKGISLSYDDKTFVINNSISKGLYGILLSHSRTDFIYGNNFTGNEVSLISSRRNILHKNSFEKITLISSKLNKITKNNILMDDKGVVFGNSLINRWNKNYWKGHIIGPKFIRGHFYWGNGPSMRHITVYDVDWHPARKPYEISPIKSNIYGLFFPLPFSLVLPFTPTIK